MPKTRNVLSVFLASPSDVVDERAAAVEIVASINTTLGRFLGWQIDLHRWEDVPPGFGRPQDLINPMIDSCDLFIGLVWCRWGTPSGDYSSGFQEEYELARFNRKNSGAPEIWTVFKRVPVKRLKSPDAQLAKVLRFRELQLGRNESIFKEVDSTNDWSIKLSFWLIEHLVKLAGANKNESRTESELPKGRIADPLTKELRALLHDLYSKTKELFQEETSPDSIRALSNLMLSIGNVLAHDDRVRISNDRLAIKSLQMALNNVHAVLRAAKKDLLASKIPSNSILLAPTVAAIDRTLSNLPEEW